MAVVESPVYQEVYYFLATSPTPEEILAFHPGERHRNASATCCKPEGGRLSAAEAAELDEFEQVEHFVRMLKLHTRKRLRDQ